MSESDDAVLTSLLAKLRRASGQLRHLEERLPLPPDGQREFELQIAVLIERCEMLQDAVRNLEDPGSGSGQHLLKLDNALKWSVEYLESLPADGERSKWCP